MLRNLCFKNYSVVHILKSNEFGFYVRVNIKNRKENEKFLEMWDAGIVSIEFGNPAGHSVLLFDDIFELEIYIIEYPEMLKAESR